MSDMTGLNLLLFGLVALALLVSALCAYLFVRVQKQERRHQALINVLRNEIRAMTNGSIGMGNRLLAIEHKLNMTVEKQQELENRDPGVLAYNQAARLMEMGADVDDLVRSCGIGRPEAELMALLHRELNTGESLPSRH
ncbi:ATPase involved in DNA repair [Marinobacterium lacunae]|uniref:ATPase involved in DNA repair n=2 Tax=Marinobacterium lacunae TaxID=1232683 RepID=A0A081G0H1_9GAMM|nr:ATPase involved in DNA repair [Marinobacterium lacunae]